jgi:hypothetical protein
LISTAVHLSALCQEEAAPAVLPWCWPDEVLLPVLLLLLLLPPLLLLLLLLLPPPLLLLLLPLPLPCHVRLMCPATWARASTWCI